jgi:dihydropteroate synthase
VSNPSDVFVARGKRIDLSTGTKIMGILNLTPDSFSDGGRFVGKSGVGDEGRTVKSGRVVAGGVDVRLAVKEALAMIDDGADIIDVGGESTRPGAERVSLDEELARVIPVIRAVSEQTDVPVSIDTYKSEVAREAVAAGASIINDISGMSFDPEMPGVAADTGAGVVLMHINGTPSDMQKDPGYDDLMAEVAGFLAGAADKIRGVGVPKESIVLDPGIGFGKRLEHNLELINRLDEIAALGYPVLLGVSRKSFLGLLTDGAPVDDRLEGSIASAVIGIARGAKFLRVHDVAATKRAAAVADAVLRAKG